MAARQGLGLTEADNEALDKELKWLDKFDMDTWSENEELEKSIQTPRKRRRHLEILDPNVQLGTDKFFVDQDKRFEVTSVGGVHKNSIRYQLRSVKTGKTSSLHLMDCWGQNQPLRVGYHINIVDCSPDENNVFAIDRHGGYIIIDPDNLLPVTSVVSQVYCARRSVFTEKLRFNDENVDMFRGVLAHDLISQAMLKGVKGYPQVNTLLTNILAKPSMILKAYGLHLDGLAVISIGKELVPWVVKFMCDRFKSTTFKGSNLESVIDIEDTYWSPTFGIKGKVDATISVRTDDGEMQTVPLEFKTGSVHQTSPIHAVRSDHKGQLGLYTLLMRARYGTISKGIFYNIRGTYWQDIIAKPTELQELIKMRNELAINVTTTNGIFTDLPRPEPAKYTFCSSCPYKPTCSLLLKGSQDEDWHNHRTEAEKELRRLFQYESEEIEFFKKWFTVITMEAEEHEKSGNIATLWSLSPSDREKSGRCLCNLRLAATSSCIPWRLSTGEPCYLATFRKGDGIKNLTNLAIKENDFVILGTTDEICVCYCTVYMIDFEQSVISVTMDAKLSQKNSEYGILFSLDLTVFKSPVTTQYSYLNSLFNDTATSKRLRNYLILHKQSCLYELEWSRDAYTSILARFNVGQTNALLSALKTDSFLFVRGMPGTGKTHTIAGLLELLVLIGKTVLVCAYTGVAVDNILLQYQEYGNNFIRIGDSARAKYPSLKENYMSTICRDAKGVDDLRTRINAAAIIATTLLSLKHEIFKCRTFDYVIVDEASQAMPTAVIGALLLGQKYIIFGDPDQLPPVVQSSGVRMLGLPDNFYSMMNVKSPGIIVDLNSQYRMNITIMRLANKLVYHGKMQCGSNEIANSVLHLPSKIVANHIKILPAEMRAWLSLVLSARLTRAALYFNTSSAQAYETYVDKTYQNQREARVVLQCVKSLVECGCPSDSIGLIAPYRGQVDLLRTLCKNLGSAYDEIEVNTVDQYQGRQKDVIIVSFTRSPLPGSNGVSDVQKTILEDYRRLNVALTRARKKLILIGSIEFLTNIQSFRNLFSVMSKEQKCTLKATDLISI